VGSRRPKPRFTDIGQSWAELVAKQPEQAKDDLADPSGIGHDFYRSESGLMFEEAIQDVHRIAEVPGMTMAWKPVNWSEVKL